MKNYTKEIQEISIKGRFAFGVIILEEYIKENYIDDDWTPHLIEALWEFTTSKRLDLWEEKIHQFKNELNNQPLDNTLSSIIVTVIEIGRTELYGAITNHSNKTLILTLKLIEIAERELNKPIDIRKFKFSKFSEHYGWGKSFEAKKIN